MASSGFDKRFEGHVMIDPDAEAIPVATDDADLSALVDAAVAKARGEPWNERSDDYRDTLELGARRAVSHLMTHLASALPQSPDQYDAEPASVLADRLRDPVVARCLVLDEGGIRVLIEAAARRLDRVDRLDQLRSNVLAISKDLSATGTIVNECPETRNATAARFWKAAAKLEAAALLAGPKPRLP